MAKYKVKLYKPLQMYNFKKTQYAKYRVKMYTTLQMYNLKKIQDAKYKVNYTQFCRCITLKTFGVQSIK